ncbi:DNA adenine methylase [Dactylosporangium sp. CS-047395]|uniref:DNA adenine methylase n=1 Tax=Dactylosporangium sp. CS-047395 TaxID=3239936 RepID=UPI003D8EF432
MTAMADGRSFIKWAGGKTRYATQLVAAAPPFTGRYWEPFMGSAAVFFELRPTKAVLSDANPELVACFQAVATDPEAVMVRLDAMANTPEQFDRIRRQDPTTLNPIERAARVIYLNKTAFRGLWRVNRRGGFNAPYGAYDRPYYRRETLLEASQALAAADIRLCDFADALRESAAGDWVFLDPPYLPEGGFADFKRYTPGQFRDADHERLAAEMHDASRRGVLLTMTNSDTDATRQIYTGFHTTRMATRRDINLRAAERASFDLVLTNY